MFTSARLKLTAWYLLIIMFISICFSFVIYKSLTNEVERFGRIQRLRIERDFGVYPGPTVVVDIDLLAEARRRIFIGLAVINGVIFIVAGGLGYFLAGRTLRPIKEMIDEQNRFISDASHELRTPLTSLKTAMEVGLRDKNFSMGDAKNLIKDSLSDVDKLQSLAEQLLQLAQYEKPKENLKFEKVALAPVVSSVVGRLAPLAVKKNIVLENKVREGFVRANKYSLADLLTIFIDNAIKYSPDGKKITLSSSRQKNFLYIYIKDQGIGIAKKDIPNLFNRFFRADAARAKEGTGGYGLGLSIAKRIVETHRGTIKVESKIKKGTTIIVGLPYFS